MLDNWYGMAGFFVPVLGSWVVNLVEVNHSLSAVGARDLKR